jgi:hypothetical protein
MNNKKFVDIRGRSSSLTRTTLRPSAITTDSTPRSTPTPATRNLDTISQRPTPTRSATIQTKSPSITRFSKPAAPAAPKPASPKAPSINLPPHPIINRLREMNRQKHLTPKAPTPTPQDIKNQAISEALQQISAKQDNEKAKNAHRKKTTRIISIIIAILVIIFFGAFIYFSMPSLSIGLARAQSGINASFPEYIPEGYKVSGPLRHQDGEVSIDFKSKTSEQSFVLKQARSTWDSTAVKNMVTKESNGEFLTSEERGLTIFSYRGNAAWVSGGILHTIVGDAPLSSDIIRRIAVSL